MSRIRTYSIWRRSMNNKRSLSKPKQISGSFGWLFEIFSSERSLLSHVQHLSQSRQRMEMFWIWKVSIARAELKIPVNLVRKDEKLGRLAREPGSLRSECLSLSWLYVIYFAFSRIPKAILKWVLSTLEWAPGFFILRYSDSHTSELRFSGNNCEINKKIKSH